MENIFEKSFEKSIELLKNKNNLNNEHLEYFEKLKYVDVEDQEEIDGIFKNFDKNNNIDDNNHNENLFSENIFDNQDVGQLIQSWYQAGFQTGYYLAKKEFQNIKK
jgi:hypothetical protein